MSTGEWRGQGSRSAGAEAVKGRPHFNGGRTGPESKMLYNAATNG